MTQDPAGRCEAHRETPEHRGQWSALAPGAGPHGVSSGRDSACAGAGSNRRDVFAIKQLFLFLPPIFLKDLSFFKF